MDSIKAEEKELKIAEDNLQFARNLLPEICAEGQLDDDFQEALWEEWHDREEELKRRRSELQFKKDELNISNPHSSFKLKYSVRIEHETDNKGKIIIYDNKVTEIFFSDISFLYLYHLAKKHQQDKSEGKKGIDIGWVKDIELLEPVTAWKSLSSVREARKKAQSFFEETPYQKLIIERGTEKNNAKKKGFRISSSNVLVCKKPTG